MIIRASALGEIMAPAKKGEPTAGAKTFIKRRSKRNCSASATCQPASTWKRDAGRT